MANLLFCNIGWMARYQGLKGQPDKIVGGGRYVNEHGEGGEVCNFLSADDGFVYGHVETIQERKTGEIDRQIRLEEFGGGNGSSDIFDVVWTATDPEKRGRKVIGWYENATVFRERQYFERFPSKQHRKDDLKSYRVKARAKNIHLLNMTQRDAFELGRGPGWMGHTPWWTPKRDSSADVQKLAQKVRRLLDRINAGASVPNKPNGRSKSPGASTDPYVRYVTEYEVTITPRHANLQTRFESFLRKNGATDLKPNIASVDLRYRDSSKQNVLSEIKPCDPENRRYAIRSAMGQLLDYAQRCHEKSRLLIVIETAASEEDRALALSNGFGLAYPSKSAFQMHWPG